MQFSDGISYVCLTESTKIDQNLNEPFSEVDFGFCFVVDYGAKQAWKVDLIKAKFLHLKNRTDVASRSQWKSTNQTAVNQGFQSEGGSTLHKWTYNF